MVFADRPLNVTANWKTQYYLAVESVEGGMVTGTGWYDVGKLARISIQTTSIPEGFWSSNNFDRWIGDYEGDSAYATVIVNKPKTVIAEWKQDSTPGIYNSLILAGLAAAGPPKSIVLALPVFQPVNIFLICFGCTITSVFCTFNSATVPSS